jgi:hypothetical protein
MEWSQVLAFSLWVNELQGLESRSSDLDSLGPTKKETKVLNRGTTDIQKKYGGKIRTELVRPRARTSGCNREHSGSVEGMQFLDQLSDDWLLEKDSATWSYKPSYLDVFGKPDSILQSTVIKNFVRINCHCILSKGIISSGIKQLNTHLYPVPRSRMVELYLHSPIFSWHCA